MLDTVQIVLLFIIVIVSLLLVILGIQVFIILKELRRTISKANSVLDHASSITQSVSGPLHSLFSLTSGLKTGSILALLKLAKNFIGKDKEDKKEK